MKKTRWYLTRYFKYYILKPHYKKLYGSFETYCKQQKLCRKNSFVLKVNGEYIYVRRDG
ncbi:hypothetical protein [Psychrilyobacter atlanticus]|uniref:hypothetical protein n=1 Tax=Psychrilyobacter atlanticus TaxID=271091 RepID=UPI0012EB81B3|nr:hypothetical protein [Psychrilyobacter atlanticus]